MSDNVPELGSTEPNNTWAEKQDYIVRFMDELESFIVHKVMEFELPPVVVVGAIEILKANWSQPGGWFNPIDDDDSTDDQDPGDAT